MSAPQETPANADITYWCEGSPCCNDEWERAHLRFESADSESHKFLGRYRTLGVEQWPRSLHIVELFCGRGTGLKTLEQLGFTHLEGVDLSPRLLNHYRGPARLYVGDCRELRFPDASKDAIIVQGGLHHLPALPADLELTLCEIQRVLKPGGRFVAVEPWLTPFLSTAHWACRSRVLRRAWSKLDALAAMIELERDTYFAWLDASSSIQAALARRFRCEFQKIGFGKLLYVGRSGLPAPTGEIEASLSGQSERQR